MSNHRKRPIIELEGPSSVTLSLQERYETLAAIFVHQYFETYRRIGERFGWEVANEIAIDVPAPSVPLLVEGYRRKFDLNGEGAMLLSQVMQAEFQAEGSDVIVRQEDATSACFEVDCSFGAMWQSGRVSDVHVEEGLCHHGCAGFMTEVGATMTPRVTATRRAWMGDGALRCIFELSTEDGSEAPRGGSATSL